MHPVEHPESEVDEREKRVMIQARKKWGISLKRKKGKKSVEVKLSETKKGDPQPPLKGGERRKSRRLRLSISSVLRKWPHISGGGQIHGSPSIGQKSILLTGHWTNKRKHLQGGDLL